MGAIARAAGGPVRVIAALCAAGAVSAEVVRDGSLGAAPAGVVPSGFDSDGNFANYLITPELGQAQPAAAPRNLFHSFGEFDLTQDEIATFTGPPSVANVFGRITGGTPSDINGTVRSTIDGANVFLLNPFGIVFGPDAQLDVRGSFTASSADAVRFETGEQFATGAPIADGPLLSVSDPAGFGFTRATPGSIEIDRSGLPTVEGPLSVPTGETLALIGGDVRVAGRGLNVLSVSIAGGSFEVASVRGPAEVPVDVAAFQVDGLAPEQLGEVAFTQQAIIDVSESGSGSAGGGRVVVRGGQLVIDQQSTVTTATLIDVDAPAVGIDVAVAGDFVVAGVPGLAEGEQNTLVRTSSLNGAGSGAGISIEAGTVVVRDGALVSTESFVGSGRGGDLVVQADSVRIENGGRADTTTGFGGSGTGRGGDLRIDAGAIEVAPDGVIGTVSAGEGRGGDLILSGGRVLVQGEVSALGEVGPGGDLSIEGDQVVVRDGGFVTTQAFGDEDAGQIAIDAGTLEVSGSLSGIAAFAAPTSLTGGTGNGGSIAVTAEQVALRDGAQLTVSTQGDGNAGRIDVQADRLSIEGIDVNGNRSGIFSQVQAGVTGDGGAIDLTLAALAIRDGGQISATTTSDLGGLPGSVHITAQDVGIINSEDAIVAASESQFNDAGDIRIAAANRVELRDSSISAGATLTGGGNIDIQAGDAILLRRSVGDPSLSEKGAAILANLGPFSTRQGGNVRLAAPVVVLDSAGIVANAPAGLGGSVAMSSEAFFVPGGRLTEISPGLFVAAGDTFIDVSGGLTVGELQIRSPDAAVVTQIATLGQDFLDVTRLATDECAARERRVGSLVVRGRDRIPAPPGEELPTFYLDESGSAQ